MMAELHGTETEVLRGKADRSRVSTGLTQSLRAGQSNFPLARDFSDSRFSFFSTYARDALEHYRFAKCQKLPTAVFTKDEARRDPLLIAYFANAARLNVPRLSLPRRADSLT